MQNDADKNMDTESLIIHIKTVSFYEDIASDAKKRYDTSDYKVDRPLQKKIIKTSQA